MFTVEKVEGFSSPSKVIIMKDKHPILVCDSLTRAYKIISYLLGNNDADIPENYKPRLNKFKE